MRGVNKVILLGNAGKEPEVRQLPGAKAPFIRLMEGYKKDVNLNCWIWTGAKQKSGYCTVLA